MPGRRGLQEGEELATRAAALAGAASEPLLQLAHVNGQGEDLAGLLLGQLTFLGAGDGSASMPWHRRCREGSLTYEAEWEQMALMVMVT